VIPKFVNQLLGHESPVINGDGNYSRDFTYIDNVVQMNMKAMLTQNPEAVNQVYNVAYGENTSLNQLVGYLKEFLSEFDPEVTEVEVQYGPNRVGDIPHSLASIDKAAKLLDYQPRYSITAGLKEAVKWYAAQKTEGIKAMAS
jgi:UDP-N-acetylglucosamine 4-epimerase